MSTECGVHIYANVERVELDLATPAMFRVQLHIGEAHSLYAADPGEGGDLLGIVPLRVHVVRGKHIAVYADYPVGTRLIDLPDDAPVVLVHSDSIEFDVAIEQTGIVPAENGARIGITYQPCALSMTQTDNETDTKDVRHNPLVSPVTIELEVDIICR